MKCKSNRKYSVIPLKKGNQDSLFMKNNLLSDYGKLHITEVLDPRLREDDRVLFKITSSPSPVA